MKNFLLGSSIGSVALLIAGYSLDMKAAIIFVSSSCLSFFAFNYVQYFLYWRRKNKKS